MPHALPITSPTTASEPSALQVHAQAHKLLAEAGSPESAKHAVDTAARGQVVGSPGDKFAAEWGFDSYLSLFEASTPLASVGGKNWCVTSVGAGNWLLWNDADLIATQYSSREEAERQLRSNSDSAQPEPTGLDT